MINKVKITWNNEVGEIESVTTVCITDESIKNALIEMIQGNTVTPGDSFTIEEVTEPHGSWNCLPTVGAQE